MELPNSVILLDSLGDLQPSNTSPILVCGSHCGGNRALAAQVKNCNVQAVFLNNAGVGKNHAGTRGLIQYDAEHVLACAVDHNSAEIGISRDTWESGIISHINSLAEKAGINIGDTVQTAVSKLALSTLPPAADHPDTGILSVSGDKEPENSANVDLKKQMQIAVDGISITVTDSITFLNENNAGDIVLCGSHGGMSAGHYAQKHGVKAVFFNDAGIGKNQAGVKSLESLNSAGILAGTVDCMSAEIFNGQDILDNGIITVCNQLAQAQGVDISMSVKDAIKCIG